MKREQLSLPSLFSSYSFLALVGDSGRCRSVCRGMPITSSGMMPITRSGMIPISRSCELTKRHPDEIPLLQLIPVHEADFRYQGFRQLIESAHCLWVQLQLLRLVDDRSAPAGKLIPF